MSNTLIPGTQHQKPSCQLVGLDGNAYAVMGRVTAALKKAKLGHLCNEYMDKATSGDYSNLLKVSMDYVQDEDKCECQCVYCDRDECDGDSDDDEY